MVTEYYVEHGPIFDGPYDLMAMIRKVRNGSVHEHTQVRVGNSGVSKSARDYPELKELFDSQHEVESRTSIAAPRRASFSSLLHSGMDFLRHNHTAALFSGVWMIFWLVVAMIFMGGGSLGGIWLGIFINYLLFTMFFCGILHLVRGNPLGLGNILKSMVARTKVLLPATLIISGLMMPGVLVVHRLGDGVYPITMPLLFLVTLLVFTFTLFVPLMVVEKGQGLKASFALSFRLIKGKGETLGIHFALVALNFVLLPIMPITLPITMGALAEDFDEAMNVY